MRRCWRRCAPWPRRVERHVECHVARQTADRPPLPFRRLALLGRGPAAVRLLDAIAELGPERPATLALHVDADRQSRYVRDADEAYGIGPSVGDLARVEAALRESGADSVWLGRGLGPALRGICEVSRRLGLVVVGPSLEALDRLGDPIGAKLLAEELGITSVPCALLCFEGFLTENFFSFSPFLREKSPVQGREKRGSLLPNRCPRKRRWYWPFSPIILVFMPALNWEVKISKRTEVNSGAHITIFQDFSAGDQAYLFQDHAPLSSPTSASGPQLPKDDPSS